MARMLSPITPAGRWVARMRCRPSDRAALRDVDHAVDELRHVGLQGRELVDDDHQGGRAVRSPRFSNSIRSLTPLSLNRCSRRVISAQAAEHPVDEVGAEVGHQADAVRQLHAVRERGAALVVDEQKVSRLGA